MCGIVGYLGQQPAQDILLEGLRRLEYRGYDSAGLATLTQDNAQHTTTITRAPGKLNQLQEALKSKPCLGSTGIGHTRWATHGKPNEQNAHPHHTDGITVVHNGIIENHQELKTVLQNIGRTFSSETDTEVFAHLIAEAKKNQPDLLLAVKEALEKVDGAYALVVLDESDPDRLICAKNASPLVIGLGDGENFIASDIPAVLKYTRDFHFLEDGDLASLTADKVTIWDTESHTEQQRPVKTVEWSPVMAEKDGHEHFMHKEIFEQPRAITDTLRGRIDFDVGEPVLEQVHLDKIQNIERILLLGCGTSYHSGMVAKYLFEQLARVHVEVEVASEFRYRNPVVDEKTLIIAISQSGETADTLAALKEAAQHGSPCLAICNVMDSAIARFCDARAGVLYTRAGPEIGVASTKAFVTQLVCLHMLALVLANQRGQISAANLKAEMVDLARIPREMEEILKSEEAIQEIADRYQHMDHMLYLGRGPFFPIALEGALKLKEISYVHAEGYAAGEMKHGPIALIDENMPVVVMATQGPGYDKVMSNLEEVKARGGKIISVGLEDDERLANVSTDMMTLPQAPFWILPILSVLPLQILAYHIAKLRGTDIDQPRNLAKSVTVE